MELKQENENKNIYDTAGLFEHIYLYYCKDNSSVWMKGNFDLLHFWKIIKTAKDSGGSAHTESTQLTISSVMEMFLTHTKSSITLLTPALYCIIVEAEYVFVIFYGS